MYMFLNYVYNTLKLKKKWFPQSVYQKRNKNMFFSMKNTKFCDFCQLNHKQTSHSHHCISTTFITVDLKNIVGSQSTTHSARIVSVRFWRLHTIVICWPVGQTHRFCHWADMSSWLWFWTRFVLSVTFVCLWLNVISKAKNGSSHLLKDL